MTSPSVASVGAHLGGSNSTTANVPVPSGVTGASGEVVLVAMYVETTQAVTPSTGFVEAANSPVIATGSGGHYLHVYWKRATGAESGTYPFTVATGVFWRDAFAVRLTGCVSTGNPFDVTASAANSTAHTTSPAVSGTTNAVNELLLWIAGNYAGTTVTTNPTGFTKDFDVSGSGLTLEHKAQSSQGATGTVQATYGASTESTAWLGAAMSVAPATGGGSAPDDYAITGTTYYVSPSGSDSNNGTSSTTPWLTIAKAMTQSYTAGDALLFERGGTYYGSIQSTPTPSGSLYWTIGAYGTEAAPPCINNYKVLNNSSAWTNTSGNIWRIDITNPATHSGNTGNTTWNIGHLRVGDHTYGNLLASTGALAAQWDFYADGTQYLYVYSVGNPTTVAGVAGLRAAPDGTVIELRSNTGVADLEMIGSGGQGFDNAGTQVDNIWIRRCIVHHCGGAELVGQNARYGNGIQAWIPSNNWLVEDNEIYEVYDTATTVQGDTSFGTTSNNIVFQNNHIHDCSQFFEVWQGSGAGMYGIYFQGNLCEDAGEGWAGPVRPNQDLRCDLLAAATWDTPTGGTSSVTIQNNTCIRAHSMYWFSLFDSTPGIVSQNNDIQLISGTKIHELYTETINSAASWQSASGKESGSVFTVL